MFGPKVLLVSGVALTVTSFVLYMTLYFVADGITRVSCELQGCGGSYRSVVGVTGV